MSSDEDGTPVKLYNPLERNRKRQQFGTSTAQSFLSCVSSVLLFDGVWDCIVGGSEY